MIGVVDYGFYIPKYRIRIEEIAKVWGKNPSDIENSLAVYEKAVAGVDEDSLTMAYEASVMVMENFKKKQKIRAVYFGSETPSYAVNPTSTILANFLGIEGNYLGLDHQFACKGATGAIISLLGLIKAGEIDYGLVCASDKANAKTQDALEYTAGSASVSLLLGTKDLVLEVLDWESFSSDTPDFWRREGIRYPSHGGRFTGKPSYFYHIYHAGNNLLKKTGLKVKDFQYTVFHMPNGKFPQEIAQIFGFQKSQIEDGLVVKYLGNSYTASALMGLVAVLEKAKKDNLIFFVSYGSGAGSDAFIFRVTKNIEKKRKNFSQIIKNKEYINYATYLKFMNFI
ncbi:MAG: hydroxymethylglutaryl-CoA synthase [Patescibacteria group bacterium]|nr:hydroxymethylglutaryl-CoA synthase [Patescibacteria group bacterium]